MNLNEFKKQTHHELTKEIEKPKDIKINNVLIKEFIHVDYDIDVDYIEALETLEVRGVINFIIKVIDARDGEEFEYSNWIDWEDEYSFNTELNDQANILLENEFDVEDYVIEQINMNIPVNISKNSDTISKIGSGWKLLSEEQFYELEEDNPDPRWDKLSELEKEL